MPLRKKKGGFKGTPRWKMPAAVVDFEILASPAEQGASNSSPVDQKLPGLVEITKKIDWDCAHPNAGVV